MSEPTEGNASEFEVDAFAKGAVLLVFSALLGAIIEILVANLLA
jgi:hypothetical protein